jgi:hypothetical protein
MRSMFVQMAGVVAYLREAARIVVCVCTHARVGVCVCVRVCARVGVHACGCVCVRTCGCGWLVYTV